MPIAGVEVQRLDRQVRDGAAHAAVAGEGGGVERVGKAAGVALVVEVQHVARVERVGVALDRQHRAARVVCVAVDAHVAVDRAERIGRAADVDRVAVVAAVDFGGAAGSRGLHVDRVGAGLAVEEDVAAGARAAERDRVRAGAAVDGRVDRGRRAGDVDRVVAAAGGQIDRLDRAVGHRAGGRGGRRAVERGGGKIIGVVVGVSGVADVEDVADQQRVAFQRGAGTARIGIAVDDDVAQDAVQVTGVGGGVRGDVDDVVLGSAVDVAVTLPAAVAAR